MTKDPAVRVSLRLKGDVHAAVVREAERKELDPATMMQSIIEAAVIHLLPERRRAQIEAANQLYGYAQRIAKNLFEEGGFDAHFTRTVFRRMLADREGLRLYLTAIDADDPLADAPGKTPVNMYLGWHIKNAVPAEPLVDAKGKAKRAFVRNEAIKSYTLLQRR